MFIIYNKSFNIVEIFMKKLLSLTCLLLLVASLSRQAKSNGSQNFTQVDAGLPEKGLGFGAALCFHNGVQDVLERSRCCEFISKYITNNSVLDGTDVSAVTASLVSSYILYSVDNLRPEEPSLLVSRDDFSVLLGGQIGTYAGRKLVDSSVLMLNWCSKKASGNDNVLINTKKYASDIKTAKLVVGIIGSTVGYTFARNKLGS